MRREIDLHPAQREEQISIARRALHARSELDEDDDDGHDDLRHACEVILCLSDTPADRLLADEVLRSLEERIRCQT